MASDPQRSHEMTGPSPAGSTPPDPSDSVAHAISPIGFLARVIVVGILFVAGLAILMLGMSPPPRSPLSGLAEARLADGTRVSVVAVTTGLKHEWQPPWQRTWWDWYRNRRRPHPPNVTLNNPEMLIWLVRHDGESERPLLWTELRHARVEVAGETIYPEDVRVFRSDPGNDGYNSSYSSSAPFNPDSFSGNKRDAAFLYVLHVPLPPAGCGPLSLTLLGDRPADKSPRPELVRLELPEPSGLNPRSAWTASPLPATSTVGRHQLTLKSLRNGGNSYSGNDEFSTRFHYQFEVELTSDGAPAPTRIVEHGPLTDSAGNVQSRGYAHGARHHFAPHRFTVTAQVPSPEAIVAGSHGHIEHLPIPANDSRQESSLDLPLRDGRIRVNLLALGGRGKVTHPDPTPTSTMNWGYFGNVRNEQFHLQRTRGHSRTGSGLVELVAEAKLVHLLYEATGLTPRETLIVKAVRDDQNREVPFFDTEHYGARFLFANPAADAKTLRIEWEVQDTEIFEFTINPPASPDPSRINP